MPEREYRQRLPALDLSLERHTQNVPDDGWWYLLRRGEQIGRYRTKTEAQYAWKVVLLESGWKAPVRKIDAAEVLHREAAERWARNRGG